MRILCVCLYVYVYAHIRDHMAHLSRELSIAKQTVESLKKVHKCIYLVYIYIYIYAYFMRMLVRICVCIHIDHVEALSRVMDNPSFITGQKERK